MKPAFPIYSERRDVRLMWILGIIDLEATSHEADSIEVIPFRPKTDGCGILNFSTKSQIWEILYQKVIPFRPKTDGCGILNFSTKSQIWEKLVGGKDEEHEEWRTRSLYSRADVVPRILRIRNKHCSQGYG